MKRAKAPSGKRLQAGGPVRPGRGAASARPVAKVTLGPLRAGHAPAIVRWLRDPDVGGNLGLRAQPTLPRTRAFIASAASSSSAGAELWARAILLDDRHVGTVVLDHFDRHLGKARLHIYIGDPAARGHGVGQQAVAQTLAAAFGPLGLHKVWLTVHARNLAAIRAYLAAGFAVEGTHRDEFLLGGERLDELYMGALATPAKPKS